MKSKMYKKGEQINSIAELEVAIWDGLYIYIVFGGRGRPIHREFLKSWPYRTVANHIRLCKIFRADKLR